MKKLFLALCMLVSSSTFAMEGSWFGVNGSYENMGISGTAYSGFSTSIEGGYWYLGNLAYGGYFKSNFLENNIRMYDLGAFWKAGTEQGLYGKLIAGVSFMNNTHYRVSSKSFFFGLAGGFLFPVSETFQIGPEVVYRHLTAGNGGDQVSVGALVSYGF